MDGPRPELLDFWKTLWHVDVYKDHRNTYDAKIINSFLPESKYTTTQIIDDKYKISTKDELANRSGGDGNAIGFTELFMYLTGINFAYIQNQPVGYKIESTLNPILMGKQVKYQIEVFDDKGNGLPSKLDSFIGPHNISLFVDTSSHLPELLQNYTKKDKIAYAYTREIESDPADKTTYLSIRPPPANQNNFFYELEAPNNPTIITYPNYSPATAQDGMSYFYCKYPVFLSNKGIREPKKFNLKTTLSYVRNNGKTITVTDGANTAGAFDKFKNGLKKVAGLGSDKDMKEIIFISKHHGDVAQTLVKFRDVKMKCPKTETLIDTADYEVTFVSIDVNAIIKALTIETPFIFMYPPDKKRIIVWKNNSLNTPEVQFESEKKFTNELQAKLLTNIEKYNNNVLDININRALVLAKIQQVLSPKEILAGQPLEFYAAEYREVLKTGVHISTLLNYVPKSELVMIDINTANKQAEIDNITIEEGYTEAQIKEKIIALKNIQKKLSQIESQIVIPINYRTVLLQGGNLEPVSFEKDVIVEFKKFKTKAAEAMKPQAKLRAGPTYSFKQGDRRVDHMWEVTSLAYNIGDFSIDSLSCRFGTKMNNSWAFDIIHYIYNNLGDEYKNNFIQTLFNIVKQAPGIEGKPTKLDTFNFGLGIIGIQPVVQGGKRRIRRGGVVETITTTIPTKYVIPFTKSEQEKVYPELIALESEYNDMIAHLEFMLDIIYLNNYSGKIQDTAFELFGLRAYDKFFKRVYGSNYEVSSQTLAGLSAKRRQEQTKMKGGAKYSPFQAKLIKEVFEADKEPVVAGAGAPEIITPVFDVSNYLTTQFSIINLYEEIVSSENSSEESLKNTINRIMSLRPTEIRKNALSVLNEKIQYIKSLISQIKKEENKIWEEPAKLIGEKRKREESNNNNNENNENNMEGVSFAQQPASKKRITLKGPVRTAGGTRKKIKKYKFKTFKKRSKTNKRNSKTKRR